MGKKKTGKSLKKFAKKQYKKLLKVLVHIFLDWLEDNLFF